MTWLRSASSVTSQGSQTWKNILNSLPLVLHWLDWSQGLGHSIILGKDVLLGMGKDSILSKYLFLLLNKKNVYFLYQARLHQGTIFPNWLESKDFLLEGDLVVEWEKYKINLIGSGVQLLERSDELKWTGGDNSGKITVKNVYNALASKIWKN